MAEGPRRQQRRLWGCCEPAGKSELVHEPNKYLRNTKKLSKHSAVGCVYAVAEGGLAEKSGIHHVLERFISGGRETEKSSG